MTCDDCQAIIIDIARGVDVDRATREDARRHAALCAPCGEQQQEQQWLTTQLRAVATAEAARNAPPRVEIAVLAAWRATHGAVPAGVGAEGIAAGPSMVAVMAPAAASARPWPSWMIPGVALAGLAAMAMLIVWPSAHGTSKAPAPGVAALHSAKNPETAGTRAALDSNKQGRGDGAPVAAGEDAAATAEEPTPVANPATRMTAARARLEAVMARATVQDAEFLPLPYAEPLRSTEARHVVRVSMTSGDEMILGMLPADRRSGQPFEAEVLVGEDGIARAIRIVH